jgi:hypothetical protein
MNKRIKIKVQAFTDKALSVSSGTSTHVRRLRKTQKLLKGQEHTYTLSQIVKMLEDPNFEQYFNSRVIPWKRNKLLASLQGFDVTNDGLYLDILQFVKTLLDTKSLDVQEYDLGTEPEDNDILGDRRHIRYD